MPNQDITIIPSLSSFKSLNGPHGLKENAGDRKSLGQLIVQDSITKKYYVIDEDSMPSLFNKPHYYNEVIDMNMKYRMYFDFDSYIVDKTTSEAEEERYTALKIIIADIGKCIEAVNKDLTEYGRPNLIFDKRRIAVLNGCPWVAKNKYKISYHIILCDIILKGKNAAKEILSYMPACQYLPDDKVYHNFHPMRPYNGKKGNHVFRFDDFYKGTS